MRLAVAVATLVLPACAQTGARDSTAMTAALDYLEATNTPRAIDRRITAFRPQALDFLTARGVPEAERPAIVDGTVLPGLRAQSSELLAEWASVYAREIPPDELAMAAAFERTPAGTQLRKGADAVVQSIMTRLHSAPAGLMTVEAPPATPQDAIDVVAFSQTQAARDLRERGSAIAAQYNAATAVWESRTMERLLAAEPARPAP